MPIVTTVRIPRSLADVERVEEEHPELMEEIGSAAIKYMTRHRRLAGRDEVLDIDDYATRADYEAFVAEASAAIARYSELTGADDAVYEVVEGGDIDFEQLRDTAG